ncbi:MAG: 4'-phosphopantetheinyl transferase superfamily protein [Bdellovibrionota bacterium]
MLGNDVVDLALARESAKEEDSRFLARVFTTAEQECIHGAPDPALALWQIWSAKECLFKIVSRQNPAALFAHREYCPPLSAALGRPAPLDLAESFTWNRLQLRVSWDWNSQFLHCVVGLGAWESRVELCGREEPRLSPRELESAHSPESRGVRCLAKRLLGEYTGRNFEIVREASSERRLAPVAYLSGESVAGPTISLSHDGQYIAAAVSNTWH